MIDAGTADREGYSRRRHDHRSRPAGPTRKLEVTGIATFGDVDSIGTATFALFDLHAAQQLFDKPGSYTEILVGGPGLGPRAALAVAAGDSRRRSRPRPTNDRFTLDGLKTFVKFLKILLLVFGGIAVFVGAFTIYNTLSITVAQRSRELALLRALGATRRQVLRSVVVEALAIGTVASAIGLVAGLGLAKLPERRVRVGGHRRCRPTGTVFGARTVDRLAGRGHHRDGARRARPGAAGHARLAGLGDARGRGDPGRAHRPPRSAVRGDRRRRWRSASSGSACSARASTRTAAWRCSRPARCCCSSPWR